MSLKGVLTDFGDTLACIEENSDRKYREGLLSILVRHGKQVDLNNLALALEPVYGKSSRGEVKDFKQFWELVLIHLNISVEPELIRELDDFRSQNYSTIFSLYEGAMQVLPILQRRYTLALVSNCSIGLRDVIRSLGISSFFKGIVLSYEVGVRKPDRRIYVWALQSINLASNDCVFVSDEISDLEGAKEVGLKTLLVRQGSLTTYEAKDPDFAPDFHCDSISEITKLL
ncbi:MAG TPA: HAD family hydrolase [Candidatus Bathyarchaeia archaeon]|nr:HAD family hydrolase [Candidatus Bathyarchaeia archaeon]